MENLWLSKSVFTKESTNKSSFLFCFRLRNLSCLHWRKCQITKEKSLKMISLFMSKTLKYGRVSWRARPRTTLLGQMWQRYKSVGYKVCNAVKSNMLYSHSTQMNTIFMIWFWGSIDAVCLVVYVDVIDYIDKQQWLMFYCFGYQQIKHFRRILYNHPVCYINPYSFSHLLFL